MSLVSETTAAARVKRLGLWGILLVLLGLSILVSLGIGRFGVPIGNVAGILLGNVLPIEPNWKPVEERVVELIRMPRILIAGLAGAGLAVAGAALQGVFRNPLVGPQIIGVSSGAAFGGAFAILVSESQILLIGAAFGFGMLAMLVVYTISRQQGRASIVRAAASAIGVNCETQTGYSAHAGVSTRGGILRAARFVALAKHILSHLDSFLPRIETDRGCRAGWISQRREVDLAEQVVSQAAQDCFVSLHDTDSPDWSGETGCAGPLHHGGHSRVD